VVTVNARQHALFVSPRLSTTPFLMDLVTKPLIMRALFGEKRRLLRGESDSTCHAANTTVSFNENIIRAGLNFKFGGGWW
jgi:hypothetical protein